MPLPQLVLGVLAVLAAAAIVVGIPLAIAWHISRRSAAPIDPGTPSDSTPKAFGDIHSTPLSPDVAAMQPPPKPWDHWRQLDEQQRADPIPVNRES